MTTSTACDTLVWLRRDLRLDDHAALHEALRVPGRIWCAFVFDRSILDPLPRSDRRVAFIHASLQGLDQVLRARAAAAGVNGVGLLVRQGDPCTEIPALAVRLGVRRVVASHDDDPAARARDQAVARALQQQGIDWASVKDHVVFERGELLTGAGGSYTVFTPYAKAWGRAVTSADLAPRDTASLGARLAPLPATEAGALPSLPELGFDPPDDTLKALRPGTDGAQALFEDFLARMDRYDQTRDFPAQKGPSYLSVHLRFGTISVRQAARVALARAQAGSAGARTWLSELIWRDFYHQVLHHHPHVVGASFKRAYDAIQWEEGDEADTHFECWAQGRTGYPLVDAAMAQINRTGYMHNRLRMVTASFLIKHLGIDWRRGEAWFARQLNDYDLAANNGGWQWAASSGCDAQPYFRIFNPVTQSEKFDPRGAFIRRYLPELAALPDAALHAPWKARPIDLASAGVVLGRDYPMPIVDHAAARLRTQLRYAVVRRS